jgi:hypothetical protein
VSCQLPDGSLSIVQLTTPNLPSPCLLSTNLVSFLSSAACFASRTACCYEGYLLYPIKGKKGEVLPLEFTYSECQCQKSAVFSTSIPAVTNVKVTQRPETSSATTPSHPLTFENYILLSVEHFEVIILLCHSHFCRKTVR